MELGEAVYNFRGEHNYSLREFAKKCGLSHVQIMRMEKGVGQDGKPFEPSIKTLRKLAAGMGLTLGEVLQFCENVTVRWDNDDMAIDPEKQALIDRILIATPKQLEKIKAVIDLVMQS